MTDIDYWKDIKYHINLLPSSPVSDIINDLFSDNLFPSISRCSDSRSINLNTRLAASVVDTIIQHEDNLVARKKNYNKQNNGKTFYDRIINSKNVSPGLCFITVSLDLVNQY